MATLAVAFFSLAPFAIGSPPQPLTRIGSEASSAAGGIGNPRGVAADPATGQIFIADLSNSRIDEFTPWGSFVKAFGWDVAPGAVDEEQEVRLRATAGQFKLSFEASTTPSLPFNATAIEVQSALNALSSISVGGGSVIVEGGPGGLPGSTPSVYVVRFSGGALAGTNVSSLVATSGITPLSGGSPVTLLAVATRADGIGGGTGLESCTSTSGCKAGLQGSGPGEFHEPVGVTVDASGNIYVFDYRNLRVQKFDSAGRFLLMFGGEVNKTTGEDVCTSAQLEEGNICGVGVTGTGSGHFGLKEVIGGFGNYIAAAPSGSIYVGDKDRIQRFGPNGAFAGEINFAAVNADSPGFPASGEPGALAVDPVTESLYFAFAQGSTAPEKTPGIFKLNSSTGKLLATLEAVGPKSSENIDAPEALGTAPDGSVYAVDHPTVEGRQQERRVVEFSPSGESIISFDDAFAEPTVAGAQVPGIATNTAGDVMVSTAAPPAVSHVDIYGPPPIALEPPPKVAPTIEAEYAVSVDTDGATIKANINPHFWPDTAYYVQYGLSDCSSNPCAEQPVPPGTRLTSEVVDKTLASAGVFLGDLKAGTTYHYRFIANSSGGGPVEGEDHTFTTPLPPDANQACPNQAFRNGPSAALPDCRAYEMTTPVDKNNGDIITTFNNSSFHADLNQSADRGGRLTYSSVTAFGEAQSAPYTSQYMASRTSEGWTSRAISPPREGASVIDLDSQFKAFSADLSNGWLLQTSDPLLAPGAISGQPNLYRYDIELDGYEALSTAKAPHGHLPYIELQGVSSDGTHAVFTAADNLTPNAPNLGSSKKQLYEFTGGDLRLVSVLPDGTASKVGSSAGGLLETETGGPGRSTNVSHAISDDGSRIFWSQSNSFGPSPLYVRINGTETVEISKAPARFWTAAADGSVAIFTVGEDLDEFDVEAKTATHIAGRVEGVLGAGEDASRIYFASKEALAPGAVDGGRNLYLDEAGAIRFVATLSREPGANDGLNRGGIDASTFDPTPVYKLARVTPDGRHLAFMSTARLTGYDNVDVNSGRADAEVYLYAADAKEGAGDLVCASCNPTGARPSGAEQLTAVGQKTGRWAAAQIPPWETQLYASRVLSSDGKRLFFESYDSLSPRDGNGKRDVYEWEAPGSGDCTPQSAAFSQADGGCVSLISSGESSADSEFVDASSDGSDAFFTTTSSLLPQDPGLIDIYDARAGGGYPPPQGLPAACEGEACQGPLAPPNDPTPASSAYEGAGNAVEGAAKKKAHRKKHGKKAHGKPKRANHKRRAGR